MRSRAALPRTGERALTWGFLDQLAVRDRDDERAREQDQNEREQKQAKADVLAGELGIQG